MPARKGFARGRNVSAIRSYDLYLGAVSFMYGKNKVIGTFAVPPAKLEMIIQTGIGS